MIRTKLAMGATAVAVAIAPASASATITQNVDVTTSPATGTGVAKGNNYVKLRIYLATRDSSSPRPMRMANPVGRIVLTFPTGGHTTPTKTGVPVCNVPAGLGSQIMAKCSRSKIGSGWALVNTGQNQGPGGTPQARPQLAGAPAACATESGDPMNWTQYSRLFGLTADCVPQGHLWNKVSVYLGGIPEGSPPSRTKGDSYSVLFVSENTASIISFSGQVNKNVLTVKLPALYGSGSYPGEMFFGWVISDFSVSITNGKYLKAGSCPSSGKWTLKAESVYSQRKDNDGLIWNSAQGKNIPIDTSLGQRAETVLPVPDASSVLDIDPCRR
ncbi:MAG: hypothetical protein WCO96_09040 [Actinomycetes bacterium]